MAEKIRTDVDRLLLVLIIEKKISKYFVKWNFFSFSKPNVVNPRQCLISLHFPKYLNNNNKEYIYKYQRKSFTDISSETAQP